SSKRASSAKNDRLFQMQHVALNNRISIMMKEATAKMSRIDAELKQSKTFLDLRIAECCKVLFDVQWALVDECFKKLEFNGGYFNDCYKKQLQASYEMYLDDMVTKWMLDRKLWLSDSNGHPLSAAAFTALSEKFKQDIQKGMESELKGFRSFQVKSMNDINRLRGELPQRMEKHSTK